MDYHDIATTIFIDHKEELKLYEPRIGIVFLITKEDIGLHECIFFLLAMLGVLLQVKCATLQTSPFDTDYVIILMLIADLFAYAGTLAIVKIWQTSHNSDLYELMNRLSLLCGTFALILLTIILVPTFGWFTLACWAIYFVTNVIKSYSTLKRLCTSTTIVTDILRYDNGLHKCIFFLLTMLGLLLQVKCATSKASTFDTEYVIVLMTLAIVKILQTSHNSDLYELMNRVSLYVWNICFDSTNDHPSSSFWVATRFVTAVIKSYPTLKRLCTSRTIASDILRYVIHKLKELNMTLNDMEESQSQNQNGIY
ncbi:hypothetical protein DVH24_031983 [Malus domestica]|uniref:Uncharacterized protein n=1 Tax=Malus domestica TaxID=3750 RepID=A0A498J376_MALDO|nr:hypothetical protein DVH24_031983 [Malus domestica]